VRDGGVMKSRIRCAVVVVGLLLSTVLSGGTAHAYQNIRSIYNNPASSFGIAVGQGYWNEIVTVNPGHWNFEYGNTTKPQDFTGIYMGPNTCLVVYKAAPGGGYWIKWKGWLNYSDNQGHWVKPDGWENTLYQMIGKPEYRNPPTDFC
jgi:hypothetical protein